MTPWERLLQIKNTLAAVSLWIAAVILLPLRIEEMPAALQSWAKWLPTERTLWMTFSGGLVLYIVWTDARPFAVRWWQTHVLRTSHGLPAGYITLKDASIRLYEALRNTPLGRFYEGIAEDGMLNATREEATINAFAFPFLTYKQLRVKRPPSREWEDLDVQEVGTLTVRSQATILDLHGSNEGRYSEPILRKTDADQLIREFSAKSAINPI